MKKKLKSDKRMTIKKNRFGKILFTATILFSFMLQCGCNENSSLHDEYNHAAEKKVYTCSMHPQIIRNAPGSCPICGMKLIEKTQGVSLNGNINITDVVKPTDESVISNVKTIIVMETVVQPIITAVGSIDYDTRKFANIASRTGGRIEKLYIKYQYQLVRKGEKLYDIYSPELQTEVQNLIFLLKLDVSDSNLINASKLKLKLLGLSQMQLDEISKSKRTTATLSIYSPADGYVIDNTMREVSSKPSMQMNARLQNKNLTTNSFSVKEGQYIQQGETVFKVIDTKQVWAMMSVHAAEINSVKKGQAVELVMGNMVDDTLKSKIDFVEPVYLSGNKFLNIRAYLNNKEDNLRRGNLFKAFIKTDSVVGIWIPKTAVIDLGNEKVVYVKNENMFYARKINTGLTENNNVMVTSGLLAGDVIAVNAQYLIDSESFIKIENHEN